MAFIPHRCDRNLHGDIQADEWKRLVVGQCSNKGMWVTNLGGGSFKKDIYSFGSCECNLRKAVEERFHLPGEQARKRMLEYRDLKEQQSLWESAHVLSNKLGNKYISGLEPWTDEEVSNSFVGGKRKLYQRAFESISRNGKRNGQYWRKHWKNVQAFVKVEKYTYYDKPNRLPRPIQPRDMKYRAYLSKFMKPIEKRMKDIVLPGCNYPFLAKGENSAKLATRFSDMWSCFDRPVALSLDLSKFDGTIHPRLKILENVFYKKMSHDPTFRSCLAAQEENYYKPSYRKDDQSVGSLGEFLHGRCSGDPQTGCGNSLLMALVCHVVFHMRKEIFANGDDTIVLMEQKDLATARSALSKFAAFGLDVREESVAYDIYDVEWCQCRFTLTPLGDRWIRDYNRVLQTIFSNAEYDPIRFDSLFYQICQAELCQNPGVPIIAPLCKWVVENRKPKRLLKFNQSQDTLGRAFLTNDTCTIPTALTRKRFNEVYQMTPCEQTKLENELIGELQKYVLKPRMFKWENVGGRDSRLHPWVLDI